MWQARSRSPSVKNFNTWEDERRYLLGKTRALSFRMDRTRTVFALVINQTNTQFSINVKFLHYSDKTLIPRVKEYYFCYLTGEIEDSKFLSGQGRFLGTRSFICTNKIFYEGFCIGAVHEQDVFLDKDHSPLGTNLLGQRLSRQTKAFCCLVGTRVQGWQEKKFQS